MEKLRWISNTVEKATEQNIMVSSQNESKQEALANHLKWRSQFIVGRPKATENRTVEQLEKQGLIGLYTPDNWIEKPIENSPFNETFFELEGKGKIFKTAHPTIPFEAFNFNSTKSSRCENLNLAKSIVETDNF